MTMPIGMMGLYIHRSSDETENHNRLLTVEKVRSVFRSPEKKSSTISKIKFNDGLGMMQKKKINLLLLDIQIFFHKILNLHLSFYLFFLILIFQYR